MRVFENGFHVPGAVEYPKDLDRPLSGVVDDEIRTHRPKENWLVSDVFSAVTGSRVLRQAVKSSPNSLLEAVSGFNVVLGNE